MKKVTFNITIDEDKAGELSLLLVKNGFTGFTVVDTVAGVVAAQAAQVEDKKAEKPAPRQTSVKNSDGTRTTVLSTGREVTYNPATERIFNCLASTHAEGCYVSTIGPNDTATERRFLERKLRSKACDSAGMFSKATDAFVQKAIAEIDRKAEKSAERDAMRAAAMAPKTNDLPPVGEAPAEMDEAEELGLSLTYRSETNN